MKKIINLILLLFCTSAIAVAQPGTLDPSFGTGGKVVVPQVSGYTINESRAMAIQPDGKIVMTAYAYNTSTNKYAWAVIRLNTDGTLDNSFSDDGRAFVEFNIYYAFPWDIAIAPDGKILLTGYYYNTNYDFAVVRFNTDGSLDNSFDGDGIAVVDENSNYNEHSFSVAVQLDGKVLLAGLGYNTTTNQSDFKIVRLNTNGSLDNNFDGDGRAYIDFAGNYEEARKIRIQGDGKIVICGLSYNYNNSNNYYDFAIARLNTDGSPDMGFGTAGKTIVDIGGYNDYAFGLDFEPSGKIVVAGYTYNFNSSNYYDYGVIRLNTNGSVDNSFDGDGKKVINFANEDACFSVAVQSDNKILLNGYVNSGSSYDFGIMRLNENGSFDNSFDTDGILLLDFYNNSYDVGWDVVVQTDGKIIVGGYSNSSLGYGPVAARLLNDQLVYSLSCPANQTVNTVVGQCNAVVNGIDPQLSPTGSLSLVNYVLSGATTGSGTGSVSGMNFNKGTTTVTYSLVSNPSVSCSFTVIVNDNEPPTFTCPSPQNITLSASCKLTVPDLVSSLTGSDNCGTVTFTQSPVAGSVLSSSHNQTHEVVITANDGNGNTTECTVVLTGKDETKPTFTCPSPQNITLSASCKLTVPDLTSGLTSSDNCGTVTFTQSPVAGLVLSSSHNQSHNIVITADDGNGNTTQCTVVVTGKDLTQPTYTCPSPQNINLSASCQLTVPDLTNGLTGSDNCGTVTFTQSPVAGSVLPSSHNQTHEVMITASDGNGNTTECTVVLTGKDETKPTFTCPLPQNITLSANCGLTVPDLVSNLTGSDNCGTVTFTQSPVAGSVLSSSHNQTHEVMITASDGNGNTTECTVVLTGKDETKPTFTCPLPQNITLSANCGLTVPDLVSNLSGSDNCGTVTFTQNPVAGSVLSSSHNQAHNVVITADDGNGNTTQCTVMVTGKDVTNPVIICPSDIVVSSAPGTCKAIVTYATPVVTDNCSASGNGNGKIAILYASSYNSDVYNKILASGLYTQIDNYNVSSSGSVPALSQLQQYQSVIVYSDNSFGNPVALGDVLADYVDAGGGVVFATFSFHSSSLALQIKGRVLTGGYLPFDGQGQSSGTPLSLVKVLPAHPILNGVNIFSGGSSSYHNNPISLTTNATLIANWSNGRHLIATKQLTSGKVVGLNFYPPSSDIRSDFWTSGSDGLRIITNSLNWSARSEQVSVVCSPASGSEFPVGSSVVTCTATDAAGNTSTCSFTITVEDKEAPSVTAPATVDLECAGDLPQGASNITAFLALTGAAASDNCTAQANLQVSYADGALVGTNCNGTITRKYTITDAAGNATTVNQVFTITDNTIPVINSCPGNGSTFTKNTNSGLCTYKVSGTEFDATGSDNCSGVTMSYSITNPHSSSTITGTGSLAGVDLSFGLNTIVWTATDGCGNISATCTVKVNVEKITTVTKLTVEPASQQYSDRITLTATVTPYNCTGAGDIGGMVTFKIGTFVLGTAQVINGTAVLTTALLEDQLYDANVNDPMNPTSGPLKPGAKTVTAHFSGTDPDYIVSNPTAPLTVRCEDADITYNGQTYFTVSPNTNAGTVVLSNYVVDKDDTPAGARGDIRNATATFWNGSINGSVLGTANIPVGLVNTTNKQEGFVTTSFNDVLSNTDITNGGKVYEVWSGLNNYYCGVTDTYTPVTLGLPGQDFVTGGGYIVFGNNSAGTYAGTSGKRMNFGFVMRWNSSGKNLQGRVNVVYRRMVNGVQRIYQIKSNAINSLVVENLNDAGAPASGINIKFRRATISTKANLKDITDPLNPIDYGGNHSLTLIGWESTTVTTGALDRISIQLSGSGSTGLLFSSNWSSGKTVHQTLDGGKIQVRNPVSPAPGQRTNTPELITTTIQSLPFMVKALPNPTFNYFNLLVEGNDKEDVFINVYNANGSLIYQAKGMANRNYTFGDSWISGIYLVQVKQGNEMKTIKLIKQ